MSIAFTQDPEAKIHAEGSIRLICAPFRSHEAGLPEWVKNAADAYARTNALSESRNIILIFKQKRGNYPASIACLDFVGMTMTDIENKFRIWADPEAAGGDDIEGMQGGHGNGGKCYMTQMFDEYSLLYTVRHGKGNKYGFLGGKTIPGYFPDSQKGRNYDVPSCEAELKKALAELEVKIQDLPKIALDSLAKSQGFTLVKGVGPNGVSDGRVPIRSLVESISNHPQMITTIQICNIFIMVDGKMTNQEPLKLEEIEPMPDAKEPRNIEILLKLINSSAFDKMKHNKLDTLTFTDASSFWNISVRSNAAVLKTRLKDLEVTFSSVEKLINESEIKTLSLTHGTNYITSDDLHNLIKLHEFMLDKFKDQLEIIKQRHDERKY